MKRKRSSIIPSPEKGSPRAKRDAKYDCFEICVSPNKEDSSQEMDSDFERHESNLDKISAEEKKRNAIEKNLEGFLFGKISEDSSDDEIPSEAKHIRKAAWIDEEDENLRVKDVHLKKYAANHSSDELYQDYLQKKFLALVGTPKWADLDRKLDEEKEEEYDSDSEFLRQNIDMLESRKNFEKDILRKDILRVRKLRDINYESHTEGSVIRSAEFHPKAMVGLVAGINGTASLFTIDGKNNPKMQRINFENFPIKSAHFSSEGRQFIASSPHHKYFYVYDMMNGKTEKIHFSKEMNLHGILTFEVSPSGNYIALSGRFGEFHILSAKSKQRLFSLKMNGDISSMAFNSTGNILYTHGSEGDVYVWDLIGKDCLHRFRDEGCLQGTAIAISRNNQYLATGSSSGVVNVYELSTLMASSSPTPLKALMNLTTKITDLKFSPTSELLGFSSSLKENAFRLLHLSSLSVFKNFPSSTQNFHRVNCFDFSLNSGYLSIGNNRGSAKLFRLKYYENY